ncbi:MULTISPECIES: monovalent cation/H(+) antiporter subunit G [unclassified Pseudactinotalea]|uniref:monovalent cation/H(+) antiporter subunit G n=1 Tax=Micrococcales TaxID=85006 RepID=UPI003C7AB71C
MNSELLREIVASAFFITGSALVMVAAIGMVRFPDLLSRLHAATKPQVLGIILMMNGLALTLGSWQVGWKVLPVIIFQLVTAPIAAHMVGRAGYRTDKVRSDLLGVDELTEDLEAARAEIEDTQA